jgi:hypothetical protein
VKFGENLELLAKMKEGKFSEGECVWFFRGIIVAHFGIKLL